MGIYNPKDFQGWGDAFKYVTGKTIRSGGSINFELMGLDIPGALGGNPNVWVGRYTAWELQQITSTPSLFNNTNFYYNSVYQGPSQLQNLGINPYAGKYEQSYEYF